MNPQVMRGGLPDLSTIFQDDLVKDHACPPAVVAAVLDFCQHQYADIVEFFTRSSHMYFIYLRMPSKEDLTATVVLRLLELLTALPDVMGEVWLEEVSKHDIGVWRSLLAPLLARLYHPHEVVGRAISEVIVGLAGVFPNDVLYPVVVGQMAANGSNIGGGICKLVTLIDCLFDRSIDWLIDWIIELINW